jgi:integrase
MNISEIIELFISENDGYKYDLNNFISYIRDYKKLPLEDTVFGGITTKDIIQSIEYNIDREQFKSVSITQKYSVAVAQFFVYAIVKGYIKNKDLYEEISAPKIDEKSYYSRINTFISKNRKLNEREPIAVFSSEVINNLIVDCDSFIERTDLHKNKKGFEKLVAALSIKMILLTGIKYGVARKIKLNDINIYTNVVKINGFNIRLPLKLSTQLQYYMKIREELHHPGSENYLFVSYDGNQWGDKTSSSKIPNILAQWTRKN